jgi:hypothetical protein
MSGRRDALDAVPGLRELARRQCGVVRRNQLAELGVTRHHIAEQVAARRWRHVAPTVVALSTGWLNPVQSRWRAVLHPAGPVWLGGLTALADHGLEGWPRPTIHVLVTHGQLPEKLSGVRYFSAIRVPDVPDLAAGLPRTDPARAAIDAADREPRGRTASGLIIAVVQQRVATVAQLRDEIACRRRLHHRTQLVHALVDADSGAESLAEADLGPLLVAAGLQSFRRQVGGHAIDGGRRRRDVEVDLPDGGVLVIHVDGTLHSDPMAIWRDQADDGGAAASGKLVLRIPVAVLRSAPAEVVAQLRRIRLAAESRAARAS